ncbi:hypothetical protein RQP46_007609 [Phenoliferia psychrophenolica]
MANPSIAASDEKKTEIYAAGHALEAQVTPGAAHDKALELLSDPADAEIKAHFDINSPEAVAVKKKIDRWLMPLLIITVLFQNLDKATLSYGALMGLKTETHLHGSNYSWLGSLVYFGFLSWEIPAAALLQRLPIARYASVTVVLWGTVLCCHAAATNFGGLAACRFLLGVLESSVTPAFVLITGAFYTQDEQVNRIAFWFGTAAVSQVVGGLLTYGIYHFESFRWEALYLIFGGLTIIHGIVCFFMLTDSPSKAYFLTTAERIIALERVRVGKAGSETWKFNAEQLKEAFMDPRLYLFFFMMICTGLPNGGVGAFGPSIIVQFGFTTENTTLLQMAPGLSEFVGIIFATQLFKRTRSRGWVGASCVSIAVIGIILRPVVVIFILSMLSSCVSGTTKKLAFNVAYNLGYSIGNILGPQTYQAKDAPDYKPAKYVMLAFVACEIFVILSISYIHKSENARRDRQDAEDFKNGVVHPVIENEEFLDLTDKQQRGFRYPI